MGFRDQVRIFSLRYRKSADTILREKECFCELDTEGGRKVGDVWHEERGNEIWVHVAVAHFENPHTIFAGDQVDALFNRSELISEQWIRTHYPGVVLK